MPWENALFFASNSLILLQEMHYSHGEQNELIHFIDIFTSLSTVQSV